MNAVATTISCLVLLTCFCGLYVSFRLWCLLGRQGITSWFMLAFLYAIGLRTLSLLGDLGYNDGMMQWTRPLSFPMYVLFVLGAWGLHWQVREKLVGNGGHGLRRVIEWITSLKKE
jgi:hypothetical protein